MKTLACEVTREHARALAERICEAARAVSATMAVPHGAPYFALDLFAGDPTVLDHLCETGVFRKYQRVLVLDCGLGGPARWWAIRFGCRVIAVDPDPEIVSAAALLSARAAITSPPRLAVASPAALPFSAGTFTHVWKVDAGATLAGNSAREVLRVLRPGGSFGCLTGADSFAILEQWKSTFESVGFVNTQISWVPLLEPPYYVEAARARLRALIPGTTISRAPREAVPPLRCLRLLARRAP